MLFPLHGLFTPSTVWTAALILWIFLKNHLKADLVHQSSLDPHDFLVHLYGVGQVII